MVSRLRQFGSLLALFLAVGFVSAAIVTVAGTARADAVPQRVVSMNVCTDQLAMLLAGEGQLHSVSFLATDPSASAMPIRAEAFPPNRARAEEIYLMKPDLVVTGSFGNRDTVQMLRRLGIRVETFPLANSFDDIRMNLRRMGALLGREARAERVIAVFDRDLAGLRVDGDGVAPKAALYYANKYTSGHHSMADTIVEAAGLHNIGGDFGIRGMGQLPLEALIMAAPDMLIRSRDYRAPALAFEVLDHPSLRKVTDETGEPVFVGARWNCGTPAVLVAVERLIEAKLRLGSPRAPYRETASLRRRD
ncbi:MAG: ABC transporter substrate-binding protein [Alphaproteobacteria bacterium]|nr:ABC transporter substrate-binding protein [Alphaproteobacteria bacterium]